MADPTEATTTPISTVSSLPPSSNPSPTSDTEGDGITHDGVNSHQIDQANLLFTKPITAVPTDTPIEGTFRFALISGVNKLFARINKTWVAFLTSPLTTKGDLWGFSTVDTRLPKGTDGLPLIADSAQALGLRYGPIDVPAGGTGQTTLTAHFVLIGNGAGSLVYADPSTAGKVLTSNGASADPTFKTAPTPLAVSGQFNRQMNTASGTVVVAHGLSRTPILVNLFASVLDGSNVQVNSHGSYDLSTNTCTYYSLSTGGVYVMNQDGAASMHMERESGGHYQSCTITVDATNITFNFVKTGTPANVTFFVQWNAIA